MVGSERPVTACRSPYMPCVLSMILRISFSCRAHFVTTDLPTSEIPLTSFPFALQQGVGNRRAFRIVVACVA